MGSLHGNKLKFVLRRPDGWAACRRWGLRNKAHRIIVLTESGIEEQGTQEELIARDGTYANLDNMQLRIEDQT